MSIDPKVREALVDYWVAKARLAQMQLALRELRRQNFDVRAMKRSDLAIFL